MPSGIANLLASALPTLDGTDPGRALAMWLADVGGAVIEIRDALVAAGRA